MSLLVIKEVFAFIRLLRVFLFDFTCDWILVAQDEVYLRTLPTLVWAKHDGIRSSIVELQQK